VKPPKPPSSIPGRNRSSCRLFLLAGCSAWPLNISNCNQLAGISLPGYRFSGRAIHSECQCQAGEFTALVSMRFNLLKYQILVRVHALQRQERQPEVANICGSRNRDLCVISCGWNWRTFWGPQKEPGDRWPRRGQKKLKLNAVLTGKYL